MKIRIQDIPQGHSRVALREPAADLELDAWFRPLGEARVELDADRRGDQITLRGTATVEGEQECARCAKTFRFRLEPEILIFSDRRGSDAPEDEAALEREGDVLYHEGIELDLDPPLREALILELPVVQVCSPDCRGLCPQCGKDLNEGSCDCGPPPGDPRWAGLKTLKDKLS